MHSRILELRKELGLTQTEFGKMIGLSRDGIASYERGLAKPTGTALKCMVLAFGVTQHWLETGEEPKYSPREADAAYPPLICAALKAYRNLPDAQRAAFDSFLEGIVAEYNAEIDDSESAINSAEENADVSEGAHQA